jgi:membrane-bound serine protease (ClpP class)
MTIGILGIIVEIRTPGFGVPGSLGVVSLALFFWGHWLVRLAGWEELLLVGVGLILLAIEVFVTPGFGVTGVLGLTALIGGLGLSLVGRGRRVAPPSGRSRRRPAGPAVPWPCCVFSRASRSAVGWSSRPS